MCITNLKKYVNFDLLYCINASHDKPKIKIVTDN